MKPNLYHFCVAFVKQIFFVPTGHTFTLLVLFSFMLKETFQLVKEKVKNIFSWGERSIKLTRKKKFKNHLQ